MRVLIVSENIPMEMGENFRTIALQKRAKKLLRKLSFQAPRLKLARRASGSELLHGVDGYVSEHGKGAAQRLAIEGDHLIQPLGEPSP